MNYQKIYDFIVNRTFEEDRKWRNGTYYERHHILPKSLGGSDKKSNIALLTAKEHYICHLLLVKIYKNEPKKYLSMLRALNMMRVKHDKHKRDYVFSARVYENLKNELYGEDGLYQGENHPCYGRKNSSKTIEKMKTAAQKRVSNPKERKRLKEMALNRTPEHAEKIRQSNLGKKRDENARKNMSEAHIGKKPSNTRKISIDGVSYNSMGDAVEATGMKKGTIWYRIKSNNFNTYYYLT